MKALANFSALLQAYFTDRLVRQQSASPQTIASYRDTFRLLIAFIEKELGKLPTSLTVEDLDVSLILAFLGSLEQIRGNSPRTRNCRLAAIHSFFSFIARHEPSLGGLAQQVLAIQSKRYGKRAIDYLTRPEINALLNAPLTTTWSGQRDRTMLLIAVETGLRVSELTGLRCGDFVPGVGSHVACHGKGRKSRCVPLRKETESELRRWLKIRDGQPSDILFPNARGGSLSRDGVQYALTKHLKTAKSECPSLIQKRISPHVLRHSTAMNLLESGVDCSVIALWLGHETMETTQIYLHASLEIKERALAKTQPPSGHMMRYRPPDALMSFHNSL
jgi:site-specific recombinase XerD